MQIISFSSSRYQHESHVIFDVASFRVEKSPIQADSTHMSESTCCSFWYHLGACWQRGSRRSSTWPWIWTFCSECWFSVLWPHHLTWEFTCSEVSWSRKITTHCPLRGDASHLVRQHVRTAISHLHILFAFRITLQSICAELNTNGKNIS
jgi:hypothetical protein